MGRIGFCTAPSRASAPTSTIDSIHVGSCHETTSPVPMPIACRPAAAVHARSRYPANDAMDARLFAILEELHARSDVRAIVLRGEGKSFSSGRDTTELGVRTEG